jgi:hypothetical protein
MARRTSGHGEHLAVEILAAVRGGSLDFQVLDGRQFPNALR